MKGELYTLVAASLIAFLAVLLLLNLSGTPSLQTAITGQSLDGSSPAIGQEMSSFLWNYRALDLVAQAFVLFAAATCCISMLRGDEEKEGGSK
jgi:multisubunit Na+/H+ antiporter MnhB subunit